MELDRRELGETGIELPRFGVRASKPFDVIGKESQSSRVHLVKTALARDIDLFATSPAHGEAARILAASLIEARYRARVLVTIQESDVAVAYRELDVMLHLFDRRIDILVADWDAASDELLTSLARMRLVGEATATGVSCRTIDSLRDAATRVIVEGFDVVALPATLLLVAAAQGLLGDITSRGCGVIVYIPDGLDAVRGEALENLKINPKSHRLESVRDVLFKLALSDDHVASVVAPVRRMRDLDHLELVAALPPLTRAEMDALHTG